MDGQPAAQGFVTALLHDKQSGRSLLVAATHLKAKAGADNEQTRVHQVRTVRHHLTARLWLLKFVSCWCVPDHM
jgi:hypothetical protein